MVGIVGVLIALGLLMYLAYRGISVLILAPLTAVLAVLFDRGAPIFASFTQVFMTAAGDFIALYFPLFLLGAIFGKVMDDSGSAQSIARWTIRKFGRQRAMLAVVLSCAVLTYGGVSLFVVAFAIYPIAAALFRENGIPKRLIPGTAQRRDHYAAFDLPTHPPRILQRHSRGGSPLPLVRANRADRFGHPVRVAVRRLTRDPPTEPLTSARLPLSRH